MTARRLLAAAVGATAAVLVAPARPAVAQIRWDLATVWPEHHLHTQNANRFAREVKEATKGAVEIAVKAGGQLRFKGAEQLRAVRDGLVPMADILNNQQLADEPILGVESIPFLVSSGDELKILHKHFRPLYERIAARNNQKILCIVPWPTQYLLLKAKADTLAGLKGIKVRVPDKGAADMLTAIGLAPVLLPWAETVPALASGRVAGVSTSSLSAVDARLWEVLKYVYPTNHVWSSQLLTVNLDAWKTLSDDQQSAIEAVARRLEPEFWAASLKADSDALATLASKGMEVLTISPDMMAELRAGTSHVLEEYMKRVPASQPALKAYLAETRR